MSESEHRSPWTPAILGLLFVVAVAAMLVVLVPVQICPVCGGDAFLLEGAPMTRWNCGSCIGTGKLTSYTRWKLTWDR